MNQLQKTCKCCLKPLFRKRFPGGQLDSNSAYKRREYCSLTWANTRRPEAREKRRQETAKKSKTITTDQEKKTAADILNEAANNVDLDWPTRINAAKALLPYQNTKGVKPGKKDQANEAAGRAATGKFAAGSAPKIININSITKT